VQYIAVTIFFAAAPRCSRQRGALTGEFVLSLIWLVVVLSIGSIGLLYWLIGARRDRGGKPVLSGAGGDRCNGLWAVRRTARSHSDSGHGGLCRGCFWSTGAR